MDDALWKDIAKYLWGILIPIGVWVFNKQDKRIEAVEGHMYKKEDAKERTVMVDEILESRRQDVIALHAKIDARAEKLDDKIDNLQHNMHSGFNEIKNILLNSKKP